MRRSPARRPMRQSARFTIESFHQLDVRQPPFEIGLFVFGREDGLPIVLHPDDSPAILLRLVVERLVQTCGIGTGPKNIRSTFSFPITRTSSCIVQYITISTSRMIWIAQKCGHTISASSFSLPATRPPACRQKSLRRSR